VAILDDKAVVSYRRPARTPRARLGASLSWLVCVVAAIATLTPLAYALFASFKPLSEILSNGAHLFPKHWTFENFTHVWEASNIATLIRNSLFVAVVVIGLDIVTSPLIGYLLARKMLPLGKTVTGLLAGTLFLGVGTATLYPRFIIAQWLGIGNLFGVALVELSGLTAVHAFLVRGYCQVIPQELDDAARLDGCSMTRAYRLVIFPMLRPIVATTVVLAFQAAWNNFQVAYVFTLGAPSMRTVVVGIYALRTNGGQATQAYDLMLAGAVIVIIPIVVLFTFMQRMFVRGLAEGAIK
jgi:ABC-type glycerol-3-phosphate transport system permease component